MPPRVASAPGSIGKKRPVSCRYALSCVRVTPGSTTQSRSSALTARIAFIREQVERDAAMRRVDVPLERRADAERDDRRVMLGAKLHRSITSSRDLGEHHGVRRLVLEPGQRVAVLPADRLGGGEAIAEPRRKVGVEGGDGFAARGGPRACGRKGAFPWGSAPFGFCKDRKISKRGAAAWRQNRCTRCPRTRSELISVDGCARRISGLSGRNKFGPDFREGLNHVGTKERTPRRRGFGHWRRGGSSSVSVLALLVCEAVNLIITFVPWPLGFWGSQEPLGPAMLIWLWACLVQRSWRSGGRAFPGGQGPTRNGAADRGAFGPGSADEVFWRPHAGACISAMTRRASAGSLSASAGWVRWMTSTISLCTSGSRAARSVSAAP